MTPQKQVFNWGFREDLPPRMWGDCFRACLASILDRPVETVPNLHRPADWDENGFGWEKSWNEWLGRNFRLELAFAAPGDEPQGEFCIGNYRIVGYDGHTHHAVSFLGTVVHDPAEDDAELGECLEMCWLVPVEA